MKQFIFNILFGFLNMFARDSVDKHNQRMINIGKEIGKNDVRDEHTRFYSYYLDNLIGKKIIVFGNDKQNPIVGYVVRTENNGKGSSDLPVVYDVITKQFFLTFGKVIPFTNTRLKVLTFMSPGERWDLVECYNCMGRSEDFKIATHVNDDNNLLTFTEIKEKLIDLKFFEHETFEEYRKAFNLIEHI